MYKTAQVYFQHRSQHISYPSPEQKSYTFPNAVAVQFSSQWA